MDFCKTSGQIDRPSPPVLLYKMSGLHMNTLQEVAQEIARCTDCSLSKTRKLTVPGEGPENADLVFIGEAPGFYEDRQGRPFVGPAGRFLEELVASIGRDRSQVFITNVVKCRPPNNRDPLPTEIASCRKYLERQLELLNPKVVVTLGRYSLAHFFPGEVVSRVRGKARRVGSLTVYPMYHPAAALHQQRYRQTIIQDMKAIPALLQEAPEEREPPKPPGRQLNMF